MSALAQSRAPTTSPGDAPAAPLLEVRGLSRRFASAPGLADRLAALLGAAQPPRTVHALDGVDLEVAAGEVLGVVGESGCGKSTLARIVAGLVAPSEGTLRYDGVPLATLPDARRLEIQMVFQDPMASLNPRLRVGEIVGEAPRVHGGRGRAGSRELVAELLRAVGLDPAVATRFPHEFSGGQRQRIGIARALAVEPRLLICDEPVAALDVSVQAQVLNLFMRLRAERGLTYLFISHDLGVVRHLCERVVILYLGRVVEHGPAAPLFAAPLHPYTRALVEAAPRVDARTRFRSVQGEIPSPYAPPPGCHFHPRCPLATERCRLERPSLRELEPGRRVACHHA